MKFAVIVFPGSNCDHDAYHAAKHVSGQDAEFVWHKETSLKGADAVILPGGFSHGDYLRTGAIARFSPIMAAVADFARRGGPVSGSATGSRCSSKLACSLARCCATATSSFTASTSGCEPSRPTRRSPFGGLGQVRIPIAHGEGNYFAEPEVIQASNRAHRLPVLRRDRPCDRRGQPERVAQQHRRDLQREPQRCRADASSRTPVRRCSAAPTDA